MNDRTQLLLPPQLGKLKNLDVEKYVSLVLKDKDLCASCGKKFESEEQLAFSVESFSVIENGSRNNNTLVSKIHHSSCHAPSYVEINLEDGAGELATLSARTMISGLGGPQIPLLIVGFRRNDVVSESSVSRMRGLTEALVIAGLTVMHTSDVLEIARQAPVAPSSFQGKIEAGGMFELVYKTENQNQIVFNHFQLDENDDEFINVCRGGRLLFISGGFVVVDENGSFDLDLAHNMNSLIGGYLDVVLND